MDFKRLDIQSTLLYVATAYVLYLGFNDQLRLYIHPRYIGFTVALSLAALVVLLSNAARSHAHAHSGFDKATIFLVIILGSAVIFPSQSLTSATVSQRSVGSGSAVTTPTDAPLQSLFAGSSKGLKINDWSRLLSSTQDPAYYVNKPASISGFVYDANIDSDTVWLARFVLTCCAVDAQPVGVPVRIENWQNNYSEDQWLEVEGQFEHIQTTDGLQMVLVPESVQQIEEPSDPYAN
ncbi:TPA: TIGR03943 family protein [Candidatus Saccharibacteria bacterium]|nr:TIGR03943 family protein [Candidatus Saccharibacteria bacterium]HIO87332.1 TIGR03943 family protein [Candidatus Saccharibacteria bacterium]